MFAGKLGVRLDRRSTSERFLAELAGVTDPESEAQAHRQRDFIEVFDAEAKRLGGADFLVQGTLYPDVIESVSAKGPSATIKTHHNVGGLPERMKMGSSSRCASCSRTRSAPRPRARALRGSLIWRHPFPGPGLAVRVPRRGHARALDILREADVIVLEEIRAPASTHAVAGVRRAAAGALVGVMGDGRTYENALAIRAVDLDRTP
jgi:GMP synthase (glutamine-hydrolysing)